MMDESAVVYYRKATLPGRKMWRRAIQEFRQIDNPDGVATGLVISAVRT